MNSLATTQSEVFKYLTWTNPDGYFQGNDLLSVDQIRSMMPSLMCVKQDVFATMQDYDKNGNIIGCLIYVDIDAESLLDAYNTMQGIYLDMSVDLDCWPIVYFSGSKGFHLIFPRYIRHERCHDIVKLITTGYSKDVDLSVYRTRAMFRCNNTWNTKGKRYKVAIDPMWRLDTILKHAASQHGKPASVGESKWSVQDYDVKDLIDKLPKYSPQDVIIHGDGDKLPCMESIWKKESFDKGERHSTIFLLARYFYSIGITEAKAASMFACHPFWSTIPERDINKVLRSVYDKRNVMIGCKTGAASAIMQKNCGLNCPFNDVLIVGFNK